MLDRVRMMGEWSELALKEDLPILLSCRYCTEWRRKGRSDWDTIKRSMCVRDAGRVNELVRGLGTRNRLCAGMNSASGLARNPCILEGEGSALKSPHRMK